MPNIERRRLVQPDDPHKRVGYNTYTRLIPCESTTIQGQSGVTKLGLQKDVRKSQS